MNTPLRDQAERLLDQTSQSPDDIPAADVHALIHELQVHQIELDMQNEELLASQVTLQESRNRFAELYDLAPVGYLTLTLAGGDAATIQQANRAAAELFDRTIAELVGTQWTLLLHRDDQDAWYLFRVDLLAGSQPCSCELHIGQSLDQKSVQLEAVAVRDADGAVESFLVTLTDITELRASEQKLRTNDQQFQSLLASLDDVVWSATRDGQFLYLNRTVEHVYGLPHDACMADPGFWLKAVLPEDVDIAEATHLKLFEQGQVDAEYRIQRPDGSVRWMWDRKYVVKDGDDIIAIGGISTDITRRKLAEQDREDVRLELGDRVQREKDIVEAELSKVREELVRSTQMATLGSVAAQMAHELRNPLGAVRNAAYYVRGELPNARPELLSMLQVIDDELATADIIIRGLLNSSQSPEPNPTLIDVTAPIRKSFDRLQAKQGVSLRLDSPGQPLQVCFDPLQFRQLMDNLLSNARDAVGESGEIRVALRSSEDYHEIRVTDSGPGIPNELRDTVFDQFFTTKPQGIGLGLGICQQVVQQHGGRIRVEEGHASGTTMVVEIPRPPHSLSNSPEQRVKGSIE
jgi:PAS domain S-box-containing protein